MAGPNSQSSAKGPLLESREKNAASQDNYGALNNATENSCGSGKKQKGEEY